VACLGENTIQHFHQDLLGSFGELVDALKLFLEFRRWPALPLWG
jgi:hypothetical protein